MQRESTRARVLKPLAGTALLMHRTEILCRDKAFLLIEGHPDWTEF